MFSAAILNGGRSLRYRGCDKGALVVAGRTIRDRQLEALSAVSDDVMIVGGVPPQPAVPRARWIADRHPDLGPLAGIESALLEARHPLVAIVACDMPGVTGVLLMHLATFTEGADIVVPCTESGSHPLCAVYRTACLPIVSALLSERRLAVRELLYKVRLREIRGAELEMAGDPRLLLANVNTPVEHERLATQLTHEP